VHFEFSHNNGFVYMFAPQNRRHATIWNSRIGVQTENKLNRVYKQQHEAGITWGERTSLACVTKYWHNLKNDF
jgi:hypothetical protein